MAPSTSFYERLIWEALLHVHSSDTNSPKPPLNRYLVSRQKIFNETKRLYTENRGSIPKVFRAHFRRRMDTMIADGKLIALKASVHLNPKAAHIVEGLGGDRMVESDQRAMNRLMRETATKSPVTRRSGFIQKKATPARTRAKQAKTTPISTPKTQATRSRRPRRTSLAQEQIAVSPAEAATSRSSVTRPRKRARKETEQTEEEFGEDQLIVQKDLEIEIHNLKRRLAAVERENEELQREKRVRIPLDSGRGTSSPMRLVPADTSSTFVHDSFEEFEQPIAVEQNRGQAARVDLPVSEKPAPTFQREDITPPFESAEAIESSFEPFSTPPPPSPIAIPEIPGTGPSQEASSQGAQHLDTVSARKERGHEIDAESPTPGRIGYITHGRQIGAISREERVVEATIVYDDDKEIASRSRVRDVQIITSEAEMDIPMPESEREQREGTQFTDKEISMLKGVGMSSSEIHDIEHAFEKMPEPQAHVRASTEERTQLEQHIRHQYQNQISQLEHDLRTSDREYDKLYSTLMKTREDLQSMTEKRNALQAELDELKGRLRGESGDVDTMEPQETGLNLLSGTIKEIATRFKDFLFSLDFFSDQDRQECMDALEEMNSNVDSWQNPFTSLLSKIGDLFRANVSASQQSLDLGQGIEYVLDNVSDIQALATDTARTMEEEKRQLLRQIEEANARAADIATTREALAWERDCVALLKQQIETQEREIAAMTTARTSILSAVSSWLEKLVTTDLYETSERETLLQNLRSIKEDSPSWNHHFEEFITAVSYKYAEELAKWEEEKKKLKEQKADLQLQLTESSTRLDEVLAERDGIFASNDAKDRELQEMTSELGYIRDELEELQARVETATNEKEKLARDNDEELNRTRNELENARKELQDLRTKFDALDKKTDFFREKGDELLEELGSANDIIKNREVQLTAVEQTLEEERVRVGELNREVEQLKREVADAHAKAHQSSQHEDGLKIDLHFARQEAEKLQSQVTGLNDTIEQFKHQTTELNEQKTQLEAALTERQNTIDELRNQINALESDVMRLSERQQELERSCSDLGLLHQNTINTACIGLMDLKADYVELSTSEVQKFLSDIRDTSIGVVGEVTRAVASLEASLQRMYQEKLFSLQQQQHATEEEKSILLAEFKRAENVIVEMQARHDESLATALAQEERTVSKLHGKLLESNQRLEMLDEERNEIAIYLEKAGGLHVDNQETLVDTIRLCIDNVNRQASDMKNKFERLKTFSRSCIAELRVKMDEIDKDLAQSLCLMEDLSL